MVYVPKGPTNYQSKKYTNKVFTSKKELQQNSNNLDQKIQDYQIKIQKNSILKSALIPANTINSLIIDIDTVLEKEILKNGFAYPILIITNTYEEGIELNYLDFGLKEICIAKKHDMLIPTIVIDTLNYFKNSYIIEQSELNEFVKSKEEITAINKILSELRPLEKTKSKNIAVKPTINSITDNISTNTSNSFQELTTKTRLQYAKKR